MLKRIFAPRPLAAAVEEEMLSICRQQQIELMRLSRRMRRDIGLDCGMRDG